MVWLKIVKRYIDIAKLVKLPKVKLPEVATGDLPGRLIYAIDTLMI